MTLVERCLVFRRSTSELRHDNLYKIELGSMCSPWHPGSHSRILVVILSQRTMVACESCGEYDTFAQKQFNMLTCMSLWLHVRSHIHISVYTFVDKFVRVCVMHGTMWPINCVSNLASIDLNSSHGPFVFTRTTVWQVSSSFTMLYQICAYGWIWIRDLKQDRRHVLVLLTFWFLNLWSVRMIACPCEDACYMSFI